jgi:hypothetical protein
MQFVRSEDTHRVNEASTTVARKDSRRYDHARSVRPLHRYIRFSYDVEV